MREPKSFPKESGQEQLNVRAPAFLTEEMKRFVYNPFTPVNSIREFVLDSLAFSLEHWAGVELSPSAKRMMKIQELERKKLDIANELKLYDEACHALHGGRREEAEDLLPLLNDEHRLEVIRKLGGENPKPILKVIPNAIPK